MAAKEVPLRHARIPTGICNYLFLSCAYMYPVQSKNDESHNKWCHSCRFPPRRLVHYTNRELSFNSVLHQIGLSAATRFIRTCSGS
ncbi:hypothetical protein NC651_039368 [Populus alba x Populus x berolinensis]|nr:hypothetical protein NC651_039368 [Populus alba x Populus x berolinensis]